MFTSSISDYNPIKLAWIWWLKDNAEKSWKHLQTEISLIKPFLFSWSSLKCELEQKASNARISVAWTLACKSHRQSFVGPERKHLPLWHAVLCLSDVGNCILHLAAIWKTTQHLQNKIKCLHTKKDAEKTEQLLKEQKLYNRQCSFSWILHKTMEQKKISLTIVLNKITGKMAVTSFSTSLWKQRFQ